MNVTLLKKEIRSNWVLLVIFLGGIKSLFCDDYNDVRSEAWRQPEHDG